MRTMELECKLSAEEVRDRKEQAIRIMMELRDVEEDRRKNLASSNAQAKDLKNQLDEALKEIDSHKATKNIEVRDVPNYEANRMDVVRADSGVAVEHRELTDEERTGSLPGLDAHPSPNSAQSTQEAPAPA